MSLCTTTDCIRGYTSTAQVDEEMTDTPSDHLTFCYDVKLLSQPDKPY